MLKLALVLHSIGDPLARLNKALNGVARLAGADAWVAATFDFKHTGSPRMSQFLTGGKDPQAAERAARRIESDCRRPDTSIRKLFTHPGQTPGRVMAMIEPDDRAIYSILRSETSDSDLRQLTWISIHRNASAPPFLERERRMVELFHSQSAWLLLPIAK